MNKALIAALLILSGLLGFAVSYYLHFKTKSQSSDVQMIETFHYPAMLVKQLKGDPGAGRKIFKEFCSACHAAEPTIDINAPRINDKKAWEARSKLGMPILLKITISGVGAMPARGGCFECSDEQLREAIQYMLKQSSL